MWLAAAYNVQLEILLCSTKVDLTYSAIGDYCWSHVFTCVNFMRMPQNEVLVNYGTPWSR